MPELEILQYDFMVRALVAALLVGTTAPMVGVYLVQRRLSLIGDGMGHVALAGVAVGLLTGAEPVWTALLFAVACGVAIELMRIYARTSGDVALALMFYAGIALGVVVINANDNPTGTSLQSYLFGSIVSTSEHDLWVFGGVAAAIVVLTTWLRNHLFAAANDEEYSRASGLPVLALNLMLSVLTATTVVLSMRAVGLLLISALMIVPTAAAQVLGSSFRSVQVLAVLLGIVSAVGGVFVGFHADLSMGGTIVLTAIAVYLAAWAVAAVLRGVTRRRRERHALLHTHEHGPGCGHEAVLEGGRLVYLHDGHRHVAHRDHFDEQGDHEDHAHAGRGHERSGRERRGSVRGPGGTEAP